MNRILDLLMKFVSFGKKEGVYNRVQSSFNPAVGVGKRLFVSLFILSLSFSFPLWGQGGTFPVQVITQAIPPAPIFVSNYADANAVNGPLRVQIVLNDFEISNREVRIKTFFTGSGMSFQSNDIVVGADPLFLTGGTPLVLTNVELAPYFRFENLTGINGNQYGSPIPEGAYQFCVEVFDVLTGSRLSNRSCAVNVVFQNEPPFLVLPRNRTNVEEINPQYIVFQWTPRSINVTNVEYELSLVEIWDTQVDPQQAFLSSPPIFQTTTSAKTYVYGPADPLLLSGKSYAWRVQAKAKQGTEEIGLFKNQGFSEIFSFTYSGSCDLPTAITHEVKGSTNANIFWDDFSTDVPEYMVRYRQKNVADAEWFLAKTTTNDVTLWNLKAGTTYEYQLSKNCGITQSEWCFTKEFTTSLEFEEESVLDCGVSPDINLTNMEPLASIGTGATFKAGDFPVKILEVSGSNGRFTGKGYVKLPYLKNIKVAVEFTNILINTDQEMAEGSVRTAYDASWGNILDTGDVVEQVGDAVDAVGDLVTAIDDLLDGLKKVNESFDNFDGSPESIEELNQDIDNQAVKIDAIINDPNLPQSVKDRVENLYESGGQAFDDYGESPSGPNAGGYFNNADSTFTELENEIASIEENQNALFNIIIALQSIDGNGFLKCKECSENNVPDGGIFDGREKIYIGEIGGYGENKKYFKCILGNYISQSNTLSFQKITEDGELSKEARAQMESQFKTLSQLINFSTKSSFLVVSKTNNELLECQTSLTFINDYCNKENLDVSDIEIQSLATELQECLLNTNVSNLSNSVSFKGEDNYEFETLKTELTKNLDRDFFSNIKTAVEIIDSNGNVETLFSKGINSTSEAHHIFKLNINKANNEITIGTIINPNWLNEFVSNLENQAKRRGVEIDGQSLRQEILKELQTKAHNTKWAEFVNYTESLFNEKVGTFIEAVRASRKIAVNVWEHIEIPQSTWHTEEEHGEWPSYAQFHPIVGGIEDGLIDEILGIKEAIITVSDLMTDPEKAEALKGAFTREGVNKMIEGLKESASETVNDDEKLQHFTGKGGIQVASMMFPGAQITKIGKLDDIIGAASEGLGKFANPKVTAAIEKIRAKKLDATDAFRSRINAIEDFLKEMDPKVLDKLANIPNFEKVIDEMSQMWKKFHGGKFILKNLEGKSDEFLAAIESFESKVDDVLDFTADIRLQASPLFPNGGFLEYKSWKVSSFRYLNGDQAINQFKNYIKNGNFQYIFDKEKLLKEITDPDNFVKGKFQEVFKENASTLFRENSDFFKSFDIPDESVLKKLAEQGKLIDHPILNFVEVE